MKMLNISHERHKAIITPSNVRHWSKRSDTSLISEEGGSHRDLALSGQKTLPPSLEAGGASDAIEVRKLDLHSRR